MLNYFSIYFLTLTINHLAIYNLTFKLNKIERQSDSYTYIQVALLNEPFVADKCLSYPFTASRQ